jgi:hypothetical protein
MSKRYIEWQRPIPFPDDPLAATLAIAHMLVQNAYSRDKGMDGGVTWESIGTIAQNTIIECCRKLRKLSDTDIISMVRWRAFDYYDPKVKEGQSF